MPEIIALRAFNDNYIWLFVDHDSQQVAAVDPGDAIPVVTWLGRHPDYSLSHLLITHHHRDHTGGLLTLKAATGCRVYGPDNPAIKGIDRRLRDGDVFELFGLKIGVLGVPGHTLDHLAFHCPQEAWLMAGDTLFAGGCGRLFEGTAQQMQASLDKLGCLPANTSLYCAHEYTLSNLRFAHAVEPDNADIRVRFEVVTELREDDRITLPSTLGLELQTNPFLRTRQAATLAAASAHTGRAVTPGADCFAVLRQWKDSF